MISYLFSVLLLSPDAEARLVVQENEKKCLALVFFISPYFPSFSSFSSSPPPPTPPSRHTHTHLSRRSSVLSFHRAPVGRAGVPMEVMGLMLGEFVDNYTVRVIDVFAMPQSGTVSTELLFY